MEDERGPGSDAAAELLRRMSTGDAAAGRELSTLLYDELHRVARAHMRRQDAAHTLQPTALVHEAWMRMAHGEGLEAADRTHLVSAASNAMRCALVDHARRRKSQKRGGERGREPLDAALDQAQEQGIDVLALNSALERLAQADPSAARLVELRFFGGLSMPEAAEALGVSLSKAERTWRIVRMRLRVELGGEG